MLITAINSKVVIMHKGILAEHLVLPIRITIVRIIRIIREILTGCTRAHPRSDTVVQEGEISIHTRFSILHDA